MKLLQLEVVIWKNLIIRKRHWLLTILEAFLPIGMFILVAYARSKITGYDVKKNPTPVFPSPEEIPRMISQYSRVLYTPNTGFYSDIIDKVVVRFQMPGESIQGFETESLLMQNYYQNNITDVIVILFNAKNSTKFDYKLRFYPQFGRFFLKTSKRYPSKLEMEMFLDKEYGDFLDIQTALDVAFIESVAGKSLDDTIKLFIQRMPYIRPSVYNEIESIFKELLPLFTLFSFIFLCPAVLKRVVEEKYSGTKELMKMVGMKSWMLWLGWFIYGIIPIVFSTIFIVILLKLPLFHTRYPPVEYTDGTVIFVYLLLYCMTAIVFCFAISSFFSKPTFAMVTGILVWILSLIIPTYALGLQETNNLSWTTNMLLNLLPNMALHYGYSVIISFEEREIGLQWSNFCESPSGLSQDMTMMNVFTMLIVDMIVYMLFTVYMDHVNPGKYGVRKSVFYPIKCLINLIKSKDNVKVNSLSSDPKTVEEGCDLRKGIEIENLCKRFGTKLAVDNLRLNIYQHQITVLLGHNGAGKSTTMSMLTGMLEATSGNIMMNGVNIKDNMDEIRQSLGLCPQHNLLFVDLTVKEHLLFFAKLKGMSSKAAETEVAELLDKLNMSEKANSMADTLSGGMKRKLCLGMAIVGDSKILILDEPSSGLDPESRRELWDLLLKWRGEKTILITTHFMEEADALGDWIAIMAEGTLQCYGTPLFLKKEYDTGYHLSLMVKDDATEKERKNIEEHIAGSIQEANLISTNGNNMVFVLPFEKKTYLPEFLKSIEDRKDELKIVNISITITTLEDVFLKARASNSGDLDDTIADTQALLNLDQVSVKTEDSIHKLRLCTLFCKKFKFLRRKPIAYIVPMLIALLFFVLAAYLSTTSNNNQGTVRPELKLELSSYPLPSVVYYNAEPPNKLKDAYSKIVKSEGGTPTNNSESDFFKNVDNIVFYKEHVIASAAFNNNQAVALYNGNAIHSAPISLNLITNAIARTLLRSEYSIATSNWPLEEKDEVLSPQAMFKLKIVLLWCIMLPIGGLFILGSFILFPFIEISSRFAMLQYMCGVRPVWYWLINLLTDLLIYIVMILPMTILLCCVSAPFRGFEQFFLLLAILLLYGICGLPFTYLFSRKKSASGAFALFVITGLFSGTILTLIIILLLDSQMDDYIAAGKIVRVIFLLFVPHVGLVYSIEELAVRTVDIYNLKKTGYNALTEGEKFMSSELKYNFLLMFGCFVIYMATTIVLDLYWFKKLCSKVKYMAFTRRLSIFKTPDKSSKMNNCKYDRLIANKLNKNYGNKQIVKNIDFVLGKSECLGILGVNGAGKTTTFKMLTREEVVDKGEIAVTLGEKNFTVDKNEYLEQLGYCPQADALNYALSGREILTTIAALRGVRNKNVVDEFIKLLDLTDYADKPCGHYSGGNKRKLSLGVSLIGYRSFVLLDEPTNGVDPSARRKCWNLISKVQKNKHLSFILTSHSMVECEALCNNLKIMKDGQFEKQGTISELKNQIGGFSVKLKLINKPAVDTLNVENESGDEVDALIKPDDTDDLQFKNVEELKDYFINRYDSELKDEHSGLVHFYINDRNKTWSEIFRQVETITANNPHLIEDYAISEASLEDVFLAVARSNEDEDNQSKSRVKKRYTV